MAENNTADNEMDDSEQDPQSGQAETEEARDDGRQPAAKVVDYRAPGAEAAGGASWFRIYKPGQGYWTRMCTAGAVALIAGLIAWFLFDQLRVAILTADKNPRYEWILGIVGVFLAAVFVVAFRIMNKPAAVEFLIATESEMKKVNWTSRKELWGSTKVVIVFMVLIALLLFGYDVVFGVLFHKIGVLKVGPLEF